MPVSGCATASVLARTDGRLSGVLLDAQGKPASGIYVELIASALAGKLEVLAKRPFIGRVEETGNDGRFEFTELKPGRYLLGVNMLREPNAKNPFRSTFFPGVADAASAGVITLGKGEKLQGYELRLPAALRVREIRGIVVSANGRPIAKAYVAFQDSPERTSRSIASTNTDIRGHFTLKVLDGQEGWIESSVMIRVEHGIDVKSSKPVRVAAHARHRLSGWWWPENLDEGSKYYTDPGNPAGY